MPDTNITAPELRTAEARIDVLLGQAERAFVEIGRELLRIRDDKLYLGQYPTFETYYTERWGGHRQRAYQLMSAALVMEHLSNTLDTPLPANARVAAELATLRDHPEQLREVWDESVERFG